MKEIKLRYALIPFGVLSAVALLFLAGPIYLAMDFMRPTNDADNADPTMQPEMIRNTLLWGRLSAFPDTARNFTIHTEGNSFTRTFRGSFSDTPENIQTWLKNSPGVTEGQSTAKPAIQAGPEPAGQKIILKTGEGAAYGEILLSPDGSQVTFRVSWS